MVLKERFAGLDRLNTSGYVSVGSIVPDWPVMVSNPRADFHVSMLAKGNLGIDKRVHTGVARTGWWKRF